MLAYPTDSLEESKGPRGLRLELVVEPGRSLQGWPAPQRSHSLRKKIVEGGGDARHSSLYTRSSDTGGNGQVPNLDKRESCGDPRSRRRIQTMIMTVTLDVNHSSGTRHHLR